MEKPLAQKPLFIQDENSTIQRKKAVVHGKSRSSKPISEKGGAALESRRALNDITNKPSLHPEASLKKKNSQAKKHNVLEEGSLNNHVIEAEESSKTKSVNENLNISEEGFLHDHNKCIEAEKASVERHFWDIVLPGHDSADPVPRLAEIDPDFSSLAELKELNEDWLNSLSWWKSPPRSPTSWDSPPVSPFAWEHESVEFTLKEEDDCHV